jgi:hypothetical protein
MAASVGDVRELADATDSGRLSKVERKWARIGALVAALLFLLLATWGQPWQIFDRGPYSSDFYDAQAQAMLSGHLDIPGKIAGIEGIPTGGKTQIYFGVGPAIMRIPLSGWLHGLTGRLGILSMTTAVGVLGLASARLLGRSRKLVDPHARIAPWMFGVMAAGSSICTPVLFAASRSNVYHEAAIWGCAASLAGLDLVVCWWREPTRRNFFVAVAVAAFAVSCRLTSGIAPAIALGLFGAVLGLRREWSRALAAVLGASLALLGFVFFNWLRFRSLFSVRSEAQVYSQLDEARKQFLAANNGRIVGPQFLPTSILRYFSPFAMGWQRIFPFVNFGPLQRPVGGVVFDGVSGQSSSIVLGAPVFFFFAVIGAWWTAKSDRTRQWLVIAAATVLAAFGTLAFGSIQHRYLIDLVPALIVLACPAVWLVTRRCDGLSNVARRSLAGAAVVVSFFGVWLQFGLALENRAFVMNPLVSETRSFAAMQNAIDRRLFEGPPPNVEQLIGEELPREGNVNGEFVILDNCAGLYRFSDLSKWVVVERKPGGGREFLLTGTIGAGTSQLMTGWGWTLTAHRTPDGVVFVYDKSDGYQEKSISVPLPDGPLTLEVVADQSQYGVLSIRHNDLMLFQALGLGVQYPEPAPGWTSTTGSAPLCESLLGRLDD